MEEEETIVYYYETDPVVSELMDLESTLHHDLTENTAALEQVYKNSYYSMISNLWVSSLIAVLIGIGLVMIIKRK